MDSTNQIDFSLGSPARKRIAEDFFKPRWEPFKNWFYETFNKNERTLLQEEFYTDISKANEIISFVPWFVTKHIGD